MSVLYTKIYRLTLISVIVISSLLGATVNVCAADGLNTRSAIARVVVKYGPELVKQYRSKTNTSVPPSRLPPERQSKAIEDIFKRYAEYRSSFSSAKNATEWLSLGVQSGAALAVAVAGPQAAITIPAMLVGAAVTTTINIGNGELEKYSQVQLRQLFKSKEGEIFKELGLNLEQFTGNPELAQKVFSEGVDIFQDLRARAQGDDIVWKQSQDFLIQTLVNTNKAQWEEIQLNSNNVEFVEEFAINLAVNLVKYKKEASKKFDNLERKFAGLSNQVTELGDAVLKLDDRVSKLEDGQAVISDYIFDEMSAAQKVTALRDRGMFEDRFRCEDDEDSCEKSKLKDAMIERFEKEANLENALQDATAAVVALNAVGKIASDLGINSPGLSAAMNMSNAALGAFQNFSSGNYLGAIASVTGLFAKQSDPDAERFKIMMGYLQENFRIVNFKLDAILQNQAIIIQGINDLSRQMQNGFVSVEQRLSRMEFEQTRVSHSVRQLIWRDWKTCYAVYGRALRRIGSNYQYVNPATHIFHNEQAMISVRSTLGDAAQDCLVTMQSNMASLSAVQRFGNFVDLQWVIDERLTDIAFAEEENSSDWRSILMRHREYVFDPAKARFDRYIREEALDYAQNFERLTMPMSSIEDWESNRFFSDKERFHCFGDSNLNARMDLLMCPPGEVVPSEAASNLLGTPILVDMVNEISRWVLILAQFADVWDQESGRWVRYEEILSAAENGKVDAGESAGELMIEAAISVVDLAIASYSMIYGPDMAGLLLQDINQGGDVARSALIQAKANPYLAQNLALLYLEDRYKKRWPNSSQSRPSKMVYRAAYDLAVHNTTGNFLLLQGLYGDETKFRAQKNRGPSLVISVEDIELELFLPGPGQMAEGRLYWPLRYYELLSSREQLADRLIGYRLLDDLEEETQIYLANTITMPH